MKRELGDGFELDDDQARIDVAEVHRFLCDESLLGGRAAARDCRSGSSARRARVVGLYHGGAPGRLLPRGHATACSVVYLADVYVLEEYRGRGLGEELVREMVERGACPPEVDAPHDDAHELYRKFGFGVPGPKVMERLPPP